MKNACKYPIKEIQKKVMHVNYDEDGVESIVLEDGDILQGDVYFDCTGFQRLLIGELTEWNSYFPIPNNRAIAGTAVTDIPSNHVHRLLHKKMVGYGKIHQQSVGEVVLYTVLTTVMMKQKNVL